MDEERANANSELRYIALELTKLAHRRKKPFAAMATEYMDNVYALDEMLHAAPSAGARGPSAQKTKADSRQER